MPRLAATEVNVRRQRPRKTLKISWPFAEAESAPAPGFGARGAAKAGMRHSWADPHLRRCSRLGRLPTFAVAGGGNATRVPNEFECGCGFGLGKPPWCWCAFLSADALAYRRW
jgi:hypothetical protein